MKKLCYKSSFCVLFWGKKSNYQKHTHKILIMQLNLLLAIRRKKKKKSHSKLYFSKQVLLFHLFLFFILMYVKKVYTQFLLLLYSIYIFIFLFWMLQFTDRFSSLNHQAYWKKKIYDLNVTLHLKFPQEIRLISVILDRVWQ